MVVYIAQYVATTTPEVVLQDILPRLLQHARHHPSEHRDSTLVQAMLNLLLNTVTSPHITARSCRKTVRGLLTYCAGILHQHEQAVQGSIVLGGHEMQLVCCILTALRAYGSHSWHEVQQHEALQQAISQLVGGMLQQP